MFRDADVPQQWPMETATVVEVLREGGSYDISVTLLEQWARSQSIGKLAIRAGRFEWKPSHMLTAAALANASRLWLLSDKHVPKMTGPELADMQARAAGDSLFSDVADVNIRSLIGVIASTENRELRSTLCLGLIAKLRHDGVIE